MILFGYNSNINFTLKIHSPPKDQVMNKIIGLLILQSLILSTTVAIDHSIPTQPISSSTTSKSTYYINYYQNNAFINPNIPVTQQINRHPEFSLKTDAVRIKLGTTNVQDGIVNVYKAEVTQLLDQASFREETENSLCDIVKVLNNEQSFDKYILYHSLKEKKKAQQYFLSTAFTTEAQVTRYTKKKRDQLIFEDDRYEGPLLKVYEQKRQVLRIFSITNLLQIHEVTITRNSNDFYKNSPYFGSMEQLPLINLQRQKIVTKDTSAIIYQPINLVPQSTIKNIQLQLCLGTSQSLLHKYKPDNNKYIQMFELDNNLVVKCISQNVGTQNGRVNVGVFIVELGKTQVNGQQFYTWSVKKDSSVNINVEIPEQFIQNDDSIYDIIEAKVLQATKKQQKDELYIKTLDKIYKIRLDYWKKLILTELVLENASPNFITISPIHIESNTVTNNEVSYLVVVQKQRGLMLTKHTSINSNIATNKIKLSVQLEQNFNNQIQLTDIQSVSYIPYTNVIVQQKNNKNSNYGVMEVVLLTGKNKNKQFIIEILHKVSNVLVENTYTLKHQLHINKIYHNYNVNTNKAYYFSDRFANPDSDEQDQEQEAQQSDFISRIVKVIHPQTIKRQNNNMGIIQSQHKLTFFQYGIPRTMSPDVSIASQLIMQQNFGNLVDIDYMDHNSNNRRTNIVQSNFTQEQIREKINKIQKTLASNNTNITGKMVRDPTSEDDLQRIVITLDTYLMIVHVSPKQMFQYEYICNLNAMGLVTKNHKILNDVSISLEKICQTKEGGSDRKNNGLLGYCEQQQTVNFSINYHSIQQQKDYFMHQLFITIMCTFLFVNLMVVLVYWKKIKFETERLMQIRRRKKNEIKRLQSNEEIAREKNQKKQMIEQ